MIGGAGAGRPECRQRGLSREIGGGEVGLEHAVPAREVHLGHGFADEDPGVVDQDVEAAEPLDGSLAHPRDGGAIAEVGRDGKGTASRRLDRIDCRPGSLFAARVNRHVRALAREGLGDGGADAACRPGNKGAAAVKRSLHDRLPVMLHGGVGRRPA